MRVSVATLRAHLLLSALGLALLAGCRVDVTGAACKQDADCPTSQHCGAGKCTDQPTSSSTSGSTSGSTGSGSTSTGSTSAGTSGSTVSSSTGSSGSSGSTGDVCPAAGNNVGDGCTFAGAKRCTGNNILTCTEVDAGTVACKELQKTDACGELTCKDFLGFASCSCPDAPAGGQRYVDLVDGTFVDAGPGPKADGGHLALPTGVQTPARCRFRTFSDALASAGASHFTATTDIPRWQPGATYLRGDRVRPSSDNGTYYKATGDGASGLTEPAWVTDGGDVGDNGMTWKTEGDFIYANEALPLRIQSGQTLDSTACPVDSGPCSPLLAILANTAAGVSPTVQLEAGGAVSGVAVLQIATGASDGLACSSAGTANVENTWVLGGGKLGNCFAARSGCGLTGRSLLAGLCRDGLLVTGAGQTDISDSVFGSSAALGGAFGDLPNDVGVRASPATSGLVSLERCIIAGNDAGVEISGDTRLYACGVLYNHATGVVMHNASLVLTDGGVEFNGGDGLVVESGTLAVGNETLASNTGAGITLNPVTAVTNATLLRSTIVDNGQTGLAVLQGHEVTMDITNLDIGGNGAAASGSAKAGVLLDNAGTMTRFQGNILHSNFGPQIRVTRQPAQGDWNLSGNGCNTRPNAVYCYDGTGDNIGISNEAGGNVSAAYYLWQRTPPVSGGLLDITYHDYSGGVNLQNSSGVSSVCGTVDAGGC